MNPRANKWKNPNRYLPLDELLAMPRVRILRTLTHFDWASGEDINVALDNLDERSANAHSMCLGRMVREGLVERRGLWGRSGSRRESRGGLNPAYTRYRITDAGRRELRDLLAHAHVNEPSPYEVAS